MIIQITVFTAYGLRKLLTTRNLQISQIHAQSKNTSTCSNPKQSEFVVCFNTPILGCSPDGKVYWCTMVWLCCLHQKRSVNWKNHLQVCQMKCIFQTKGFFLFSYLERIIKNHIQQWYLQLRLSFPHHIYQQSAVGKEEGELNIIMVTQHLWIVVRFTIVTLGKWDRMITRLILR